MSHRPAAALLQLVVFAAGGIAAPVIHLASHRSDHTHGAAAGATVDRAEHDSSSGAAQRGVEATPHAGEVRAAHHHPHTDRRPHTHTPRAGRVHRHGHGPAHRHDPAPLPTAAERPAPSSPDEAHSTRARPEAPLPHGHASVSHFGVALVAAPPPMPLPLPEFHECVEPMAAPAAARLHDPSFPLPRPPPAASLFD